MYSMFVLFICLRISQCQELIVSEEMMNWTEAVEFCLERNSTLIHQQDRNKPSNVKDYWTIEHKRISPWIHVIGCFNESQVHSSSYQTFTLPSMSVSLCQQRCPISYTFFGLQNSKCVCLFDNFSVTDVIDPKACYTNCSASPYKIFQKCGGDKSYSIYKTGDLALIGDDQDNSACFAIDCAGQKSFVQLMCSNNAGVGCLCRNPDTFTPSLSWIQCFTFCENKRSYMHGDYELHNPTKACVGINATITMFAVVGIAKEMYITSYLGPIGIYFLVLQCKSCQKDQCNLGSCSDKKYAVCNSNTSEQTTEQSPSVSLTTISVTTEIIRETDYYFLTDITTHTGSFTPVSQKRSSKEEGSKTIIIVASVATVTTLLLLMCVTLLFIKRRRENVKDFAAKQINESETEMDAYSGIPPKVLRSETDDRHKRADKIEKKDDSVLEEDDYSHLHDISRKKESFSGDMYATLTNCKSETDDDVNESELYNHLGETSVQADDIYNHAIDENDCEYSFTDSATNKDSDVFCNYDHIVHPCIQDKFDDYR